MYNACYGGFTLSDQALREYCKVKGIQCDDKRLYFVDCEVSRHDPDMVAIVRALGKAASGTCSDVRVCDIPKKFMDYYVIGEYDGYESVQIDYQRWKLKRIKDLVERTEVFREATEEQKNFLTSILAVLEDDDEEVDAHEV